MDHKLSLNIAMRPDLKMTPQLQQAIKLLQLSRPELLETVQTELMENPVLDMNEVSATPNTDGAGEEGSQNASETRELSVSDQQPAPQKDTMPELPAATPDGGESDAPDGASEAQWENYIEHYNAYSYSPGSGGIRFGDDDMPTLEQTLATQDTLFDHLMWQLGVTVFTDRERDFAERVIGNLNALGRIPVELFNELIDASEMDAEEAEAVLEVIQEFDPIGVAARDLQECLLIQARHFYPSEDLVQTIISNHLDCLEKRNINPILRSLKIDAEDLREAMDLIATLEPKPGRNFISEQTHYITPDVYIVKVGDEYVVQLNEDGMPKLHISNFYQSQIKTGKADGATKDFIKEKLSSAMWLIRSIHQRQSTIRKVAESIARFQTEFLDQGVDYLRPLILRQVAEDIGMHESTISRVTTNKYVHTPQGTFELKYFFNSRISTQSGPDLASESVKQRIKKMIADESEKKPLSDQAICNLLAEEGLEIARRTVAKYRTMLNIPSASKRKRLF